MSRNKPECMTRACKAASICRKTGSMVLPLRLEHVLVERVGDASQLSRYAPWCLYLSAGQSGEGIAHEVVVVGVLGQVAQDGGDRVSVQAAILVGEARWRGPTR